MLLDNGFQNLRRAGVVPRFPQPPRWGLARRLSNGCFRAKKRVDWAHSIQLFLVEKKQKSQGFETLCFGGAFGFRLVRAKKNVPAKFLQPGLIFVVHSCFQEGACGNQAGGSTDLFLRSPFHLTCRGVFDYVKSIHDWRNVFAKTILWPQTARIQNPETPRS